jgi:hypothetical protein
MPRAVFFVCLDARIRNGTFIEVMYRVAIVISVQVIKPRKGQRYLEKLGNAQRRPHTYRDSQTKDERSLPRPKQKPEGKGPGEAKGGDEWPTCQL